MRPYREHDYEIWCRQRADARGADPDGALYWLIRRLDRHVFEAELRARERLTRPQSDLEGLSVLLGLSA